MDIVIDSREKARKDRALEYYQAKGHTANIQRLDVGDYLFNDKVVFEYKEIGDFMQSINNESLFNEATNQALEYDHHYVVVVGDVRGFVEDGWPYARKNYSNNYGKYINSLLGKYYGALRRLRTFTCPILVDSEEQAFLEMLLQSMKCCDGKTKYYSNVTRKVDSQDAVDVLLTSAKNISVKKAERIRKQYSVKNIYDLMTLTEENFNSVYGIGKTTSTNLYQFLHMGCN